MTNKQYLTVHALTLYLKKKFDADPYLAKVSVIGEVSNFRKRPTHQYFSLKDKEARIKVICFQHVFKKLGLELEDGMKVLAIGKVSLFKETGEYQLYIDHIELAGVGALFQAYQQLKDILTKEGLFSQPKKKIPTFPKKIAIITSQSGAVIHDIKTTILRRYPIVALDVYPTVVQGKDSANSIIQNLAKIEQAKDQYDTVIIARGGGSIEDLWSFNEEKVVRAIANMSLPVITSIGHETDTTLSDFVSDLRAATPTAAAEHAVPVLNEVIAKIDTLFARLQTAAIRTQHEKEKRYQFLNQSYIFQQPERLYESYLQKLDYISMTMHQKMSQVWQDKQLAYQKNEWQFEKVNPGIKIEESKQHLDKLFKQLIDTMTQQFKENEQTMALVLQKLDLLSPLKSMLRGYSYVTIDDEVVSSGKDVNINDVITIEMSDSTIKAKVMAIEEKVRR